MQMCSSAKYKRPRFSGTASARFDSPSSFTYSSLRVQLVISSTMASVYFGAGGAAKGGAVSTYAKPLCPAAVSLEQFRYFTPGGAPAAGGMKPVAGNAPGGILFFFSDTGKSSFRRRSDFSLSWSWWSAGWWCYIRLLRRWWRCSSHGSRRRASSCWR